MKAEELRQLSYQEIVAKLSSMEEEYFNLRFQHRIGQLSNPLRIRQVRRDIARVRTIMNEKCAKGDVAGVKSA